MVDRWFKEKAAILTDIQLGEEGNWQIIENSIIMQKNCSYNHVIIPQIFIELLKFVKYCFRHCNTMAKKSDMILALMELTF